LSPVAFPTAKTCNSGSFGQQPIVQDVSTLWRINSTPFGAPPVPQWLNGTLFSRTLSIGSASNEHPPFWPTRSYSASTCGTRRNPSRCPHTTQGTFWKTTAPLAVTALLKVGCHYLGTSNRNNTGLTFGPANRVNSGLWSLLKSCGMWRGICGTNAIRPSTQRQPIGIF